MERRFAAIVVTNGVDYRCIFMTITRCPQTMTRAALRHDSLGLGDCGKRHTLRTEDD